MRKLVGVLALTLLIVAAVGAAGCGSGGSGSGTAKGEMTVATVGPDSYDPALFQTIQAVQPLQLVYTPLTTYKHVSGEQGGTIIPGLAKALPKVSNGGKTYTYRLRSGLKFSDGTPVKASDFEFAMKRILTLKGPYSSFFAGIKGAEDYQKKGDKQADIPGVETDDKTGEITIELNAPDGKFPFAMSEPYAAPVPASKAKFSDMTNSPPPGAGPYTMTVQDPKRKFTLKRNPDFSVPGIPKGEIDTFNGQVSNNVERMTQDVGANKVDFMTEDPTGDQLKQVKDENGDRIREDANPPNTYYFFLNVTIPPFNKLEARQAVNYAIDSNALVRVFSGRLQPGCTFLPPAVEGHKEYDCPYGDPNKPGDIDKAKDLVEKSGTKGQKVVVWTNTKQPRPKIADYYVGVLNQIGYKAEKRTLDQQVYFDRIGTRATKAQTGFTDWYQDFPHPADFFQPLLSSESLQSTPTSNQGLVDDKQLSAQIEKLTRASKLGDVADQWGDLDEDVVGLDKAYLVPYGYEKATSYFSEKVDFDRCAGVHPVYKNDWLQFCEK